MSGINIIEAKASLSDLSGMKWQLGSTLPPLYILHGLPSLSSCLPLIPLTQAVGYIFELEMESIDLKIRAQVLTDCSVFHIKGRVL